MSTPGRRAMIALLGAAFLYGATFVVIKSALEDIEPMAFVAWRFSIGIVVLAFFAFPRGWKIWLHGSIAGLALFRVRPPDCGTCLDHRFQLGPDHRVLCGLHTDPHLGVPQKAPAGGAFAGIYLLTGTQGIALSRGDLLHVALASYRVLPSGSPGA